MGETQKESIRLYQPRKRQPRIAAIGGGHGLSSMLRGLKRYTKYITAIVTVADDGGGSGMLREDLGMLPPGDIRNCIMALANTEPTMEQLLNYRFTEGSLTGQSFGNLFLAAMNGISGSFDEAVQRMGDVLAITGRVLPVTNQNVYLEAEFDNGSRTLGESKIFYAKKINDCRIRQVRLVPEHPQALQDSIDAILQADIIVIGPGSLYTSIIPNFLVDGICEAIRASGAVREYILNIMMQDGRLYRRGSRPGAARARGRRRHRRLHRQQCARAGKMARAVPAGGRRPDRAGPGENRGAGRGAAGISVVLAGTLYPARPGRAFARDPVGLERI